MSFAMPVLAARRRGGGSPPTDVNMVVHGASITAEDGTDNFTYDLLSRLGTGSTRYVQGTNDISFDRAVSGDTMRSEASTTVDPEYDAGRAYNWLIVMGGGNGLTNGNSGAGSGNSAAEEYASLLAYVAERQAAGWPNDSIFMMTVLPRTTLDETRRGDFNDLVVDGAEEYGYRAVPIHLDPDIGADGSYTDTTYYDVDEVHLTPAGHDVLAQAVADSVIFTSGPTLSTVPTITTDSGFVGEGDTATAVIGLPSGHYSQSYQWRRDGVAISGATDLSYTFVSADVGAEIDFVHTATNHIGSVSQMSAAIGPVVTPTYSTSPITLADTSSITLADASDLEISERTA